MKKNNEIDAIIRKIPNFVYEEFLAETIDAIVPYSDVSYFNRDRQAERMLEEIKQSNETTQKAIQEQTQAINANRQVTVAVDGEAVFSAMGRVPTK